MRWIGGFVIAFACLVVASAAATIEHKPYPQPHITGEQWRRYYDQVLSAHGQSAQEFPELHLVVFQDSANSVSYAFTRPEHLAHPAWITRKIVSQGGRLYLDQVGYFAGEEAPFAALFEQYQQLNQRMMEELNRKNNPK
jgi:hypothetical protein